MSLPHRSPGIVAWIREAEEHAGVGVLALLPPLAAQDEVGKGPVRVPPQTHAVVPGGDTVLKTEMAGTTLRPAIVCVLAEQRRKACLVLRFDGDLLEQSSGNRRDRSGLEVAVEKFRRFGLKLYPAVMQPLLATVLLKTRVCDDKHDPAVEQMDANVAPRDDLGDIPLPMRLLGINRRGDSLVRFHRDALCPGLPEDALLSRRFSAIRIGRLVLQHDVSPFDIAVGTRHAPPLAGTLFHDVAFDGAHPGFAPRTVRTDAPI